MEPLSDFENSMYDLCIVLYSKNGTDADDTITDSDSNTKTSLKVSELNKRFSFWNTTCNYSGYYDIVSAIDKSSTSSNVSLSEETEGTFEVSPDVVTRFAQWNTTITLGTVRSEVTLNANVENAPEQWYETHDEQKVATFANSMPLIEFICPRKVHCKNYRVEYQNIASILRDRETRGPSGRESKLLPTDVFSRMKLFRSDFNSNLMPVYHAIIDQNCKNIIVSSTNEVQIWNLRNFNCRRLEIPGPPCQDVTQMKLNSEETLLAVCTFNGYLHVWNYQTREIVFTLKAHCCRINSMKFAPTIFQGIQWLATIDKKGTIALWPFLAKQGINGIKYFAGSFDESESSGNESDDNDYNGDNIIWPRRQGQRSRRIFKRTRNTSFEFSYCARYLLMCKMNNIIQCYNLESCGTSYYPMLETTIETRQQEIYDIKWANHKAHFITCSKRNYAILWAKNLKKRVMDRSHKMNWTTSVCWSNDDAWIFTTKLRLLVVWESATLTPVKEIHIGSSVGTIAPHPIHPHLILVINGYQCMELWNAFDQSTKPIDNFEIDNHFRTNVIYKEASWSPDGTMIVATNDYEDVSMFSLNLGLEKIRYSYAKVKPTSSGKEEKTARKVKFDYRKDEPNQSNFNCLLSFRRR